MRPPILNSNENAASRILCRVARMNENTVEERHILEAGEYSLKARRDREDNAVAADGYRRAVGQLVRFRSKAHEWRLYGVAGERNAVDRESAFCAVGVAVLAM